MRRPFFLLTMNARIHGDINARSVTGLTVGGRLLIAAEVYHNEYFYDEGIRCADWFRRL